MNKKLTVSVLALSLLAVPTAVSKLGSATGIAAFQAMPDPLTLMQSRSPGVRAPGATTTKGPRLSILLEPRKPRIAQPSLPRNFFTSSKPVSFERPNLFSSESLDIKAESFAPVTLASLPDLGIAAQSGENSKSLQGTPVLGGGFPVVPISTVTPINPVPEPGTWALMLLGFLLTGAALRRNQLQSPECHIPAH